MRTKGSEYFRPKAILWLLLAALLALTYYFFLLDLHARVLLQKHLSELHGVPVEVESAKLSLTKGHLEATHLQITHPLLPSKNLYEVDRLSGSFKLTPLLRKQLVFEKIELSGIRYLSLRRSGNEGLSVAPSDINLPIFDIFSAQLFSSLASTLAKNPLKYLAQLSTGLHTKELTLGRLSRLSSSKLLDEVQDNLTQTERQVDKILFTETPVSPSELKMVRELMKTTTANTRVQLDSLKETLKVDAEEITTELGLPKTDIDSLTPVIFGPKVLSFLEQMSRWVGFFRQKMPVRSGPIGRSYVLQETKRGTQVNFPYLAGNPGLVVHELRLSSPGNPDDSSDQEVGLVEGLVTGLTTDPYILGKPTAGSLNLSFPSQGLKGIKISFKIDHVGEEPSEHIDLSIDSIGLKQTEICRLSDLSLNISKGEGSLQLTADFGPSSLKALGKFKSDGTEYKVISAFKTIEEYLHTLLTPFYQFELETSVEGPFNDLKLSLHSTLDKKLTAGVNEEIKRQLTMIHETIQSDLSDHLMPRKQEALDRLNKLNGKLLDSITRKIAKEEKIAHTD